MGRKRISEISELAGSIENKQYGQEKNRDYVQSIDRAFRILDSFPADKPELSLAEVVERSGLSRTAAYRILNTLVDLNVLQRTPDGKTYSLGFRLWELGSRKIKQLDIHTLALTHLQHIAATSKDTASLCIVDNNEALCIERVDGTHLVRVMSLSLGSRLPLHVGASPLVLLSFMDDKKIIRILNQKGLKCYTERTITDINHLLEVVHLIRAQGYALSCDDVTPGGAAVAVPVRNHLGSVVAAISVSGPTARFGPDRLASLIALVKNESISLSQELGWQETKVQQ